LTPTNYMAKQGQSEPLILCEMLGYARRRNAFTRADCWGASVAHHDLLRAALEYGVVDQLHFFDQPRSPSSPLPSEIQSGLQELRNEFGNDRIHVKNSLDLFDLSQRHRYIFVTDVSTFPRLAHARRHSGTNAYPICGIVHSIPSHQFLVFYLELLLFAEHFDAVVTTSVAGCTAFRAMVEATIDFVKAGLSIQATPAINVVKIPFGVDVNFLRPQDPRVCREILGLRLEDTIILYLGRLDEEYKADLEPLITILKRLSFQDPRISLLIAGWDTRGYYCSLIEQMAQAAGVAKSVRIISDFPYCLKPVLYSASDVFVSPVDNIQETFGLSLLEAMACGLPIVASDWSGYRDLVREGQTGFLVPTLWNLDAGRRYSQTAPLWRPPLAEHFLAQRTIIDLEALQQRLAMLVSNKTLRQAMGASGRELAVERFSWEVVMKEFKDLWRAQREKLHLQVRKAKPRPRFSFNSVYQHFASTFIKGGMVRTTVEGMELLTDGASKPTRRCPPAIDPEEVARVLQVCSGAPHSVAELRARGHDRVSEVVAWLLKKGFLELANA